MEGDDEARRCAVATSTLAQERFIFAAPSSGPPRASPQQRLADSRARSSSCGCFLHAGCSQLACERGGFGAPRRALDLQGRHSIGARDLPPQFRAGTGFLPAARGSHHASLDFPGGPSSEAGTSTSSAMSSHTTCDSSNCLLCQRKGASDDFAARKRSFSDRLSGLREPGGLRVSHSANDLLSLHATLPLSRFASPAASDSSCSDDSDDVEMEENSRRARRKYSLEWMALSARSSAESQSWGKELETSGRASPTPVNAQFSAVASLLPPGGEVPSNAEERFVRAASTTHVVQELALSASGGVLAGATRAKQVCLYDCHSAVAGGSPLLPSLTHSLPSRVTTMSWSPHSESVLALGDADGVLWQMDASTGHILTEADEHNGDRLWSVAHSCHHASVLATSAGKSGCVKLWDMGRSTEKEAFRISPENRVPVCSLAFSPQSDTLLAAASADHNVYLYDLRNPTEPVQRLGFHSRPVSYVRFMGADRLVSSSVDGSVALWGPGDGGGAPIVTRVFKDHTNQRNFAGLSVDDSGLIACGSEDGAAYAYFPAWRQRVAATVPRSGRDCFVTSVAWLRPQQLGLPLEQAPPMLAVGDSCGGLNLHTLIRHAGFQDPEDLP
eukprot:jgi/Tetstr1/459348/TSEL_004742.t1